MYIVWDILLSVLSQIIILFIYIRSVVYRSAELYETIIQVGAGHITHYTCRKRAFSNDRNTYFYKYISSKTIYEWVRRTVGEKRETIEVSKLAKDWLTSHVTRDEYTILLYYMCIGIMTYTMGARRMCGVEPNTSFWLLNKRHMSDSFKKNKTRQIAFTSVHIHVYKYEYINRSYIYIFISVSKHKQNSLSRTN